MAERQIHRYFDEELKGLAWFLFNRKVEFGGFYLYFENMTGKKVFI
ncbi:TPA: hypothetical protein ACK3JR_000444 [Mannheimia haemolytica]